MNNILILGVGGAGCAIAQAIHTATGVPAVAVNTDRKALQSLAADVFVETLLLGSKRCTGRAANVPFLCCLSAEESHAELTALITGSRLLIIAVGLGGGTGTGALPVIVQLAQAQGIAVLVAATLPFAFETARRETALAALSELEAKGVEVLIHDLKQADKYSSPEFIFAQKNMAIAQDVVGWFRQGLSLEVTKETSCDCSV